MGFFDKIFKRGRAYSENQDPMMACELTVDGQKYMIEKFDMEFDSMGVNRYIPMQFVFSERISAGLDGWITRSSNRKNGIVKFFHNTAKVEQGAVFTLSFYDAVCVGYKKAMSGDVPFTTLDIITHSVKLEDQQADAK